MSAFHDPQQALTLAAERGKQYAEYYKLARNVPNLGAVFAFVLSASSGFDTEVWRREDGSPTAIVGAVGSRPT